ncbi:MAG: hypothetical protein EPN53_11150 [Acidobacteria bacterium]|nr:MAG: hypothetical protein EPN53_11150 [Acidobacteriota bacterium]
MGFALYCGAAAPADVGTLVKDICTNITFSSNPIGVTRVGERILFFAQDDAGHHLWSTDGTPAGTRLVADLVQPPLFPLLFDGLPLGRYFYFSFTPINPYCPTECYYGTFLYVTEGSGESTRLVAGGWPEDQRKRLSRLAVSAGCLYDSGTDLVHGRELWKACPPPDSNARRHLKRAR